MKYYAIRCGVMATLLELAAQYRENEDMLQQRIDLLKYERKTKKLDAMRKKRLSERIIALEEIKDEQAEAAQYMEHYYDKKEKENNGVGDT